MKRILIVDDIEENLELQRIMLEGHGYEVEQARNGSEAITKALEKVPDMIISDILMPIMDGFTLCNKWKADERLKQVPFIFCTATYTDLPDEQLAINMGADAFIVKPMERGEFLSRIDTILSSNKERMPASSQEPKAAGESILKNYNEVLIRKLEKKMIDLERVNRELEAVITAKDKIDTVLRESEESYRTLADSGQVLIWTSGPDKKHEYFNKQWLAFTGRTLEQEQGDGWAEGVHPDDLERCINTFDAAFSRSESFNVVYRLRRNDGEYRWILDNGMLRFDAKGVFLGYIGHCLDITEQRRAEESLLEKNNELTGTKKQLEDLLSIQDRSRLVLLSILEDEKIARQVLYESEKEYRTLVETVPCIICTIMPDGTVVFVNPYIETVTGYTVEEVMGGNWWDLFYPGELREQTGKLLDVFKKGDVHGHEMKLAARDGALRTIHWDSFNLYGPAGELIEINGAGIDITERERAGDALRESEERYRRVFNTSADGMFLLDRGDGRILDVNESACLMYGYSRDEMLSLRIIDLSIEKEKTINALRSGLKLTSIRYHKKKSGTFMPVELVATYFNLGGRAVSVVNSRDITDRLKSEKALQESEERYRLIVDNMADSIWMTDMNYRYIFTTPSMMKERNFTIEELNAMPMDKNFTPDSFSLLQATIAEELTPERLDRADLAISKTLELEFIKKNGSTFWAEVNYKLIRDDYGRPKAILGVSRDVTSRKEVQRALLQSERFAIGTVNALDANIAILDDAGTILSVNNAWREFAFANGGDPEHVLEGLNYLDMCDSAMGEHSEGAAEFAAGIRAVMAGQTDFFSMEYPCHSPGEKRWFIGKVTRFQGGAPVRIVVAHTNITERKLAEEKTSASLREKEALLREIHHRVKNNLQVISSLIGLQAFSLNEVDIAGAFQDMQNRIKSMAIIHESLYRSDDLGSISFSQYVQGLADNLFMTFGVDPGKITFKTGINIVSLGIETAVPCGLIINELLTNALKHAFPGDRKGVIEANIARKEDGVYLLSVKDDGVGMADGIDVGKAETLGLRLVNILTQQLSGRLEVKRGGGTEFLIEFMEQKG